MKNINTEEFDFEVLGQEGKSLVLFYATWCPFCSSFKSSFESSSLQGVRKLCVVIDEDENPLWERFDIEAVPTMIAFFNGKIIARKDAKKGVGLTKMDMESIKSELDNLN